VIKVITWLLIAFVSFFVSNSAYAGENYRLEVNRFDDTITAGYRSSVGRRGECKIIKGDGNIEGCYFVNTTERFDGIELFPALTLKNRHTNQDRYGDYYWDHLSDYGDKELYAIITYQDNSVERIKFPGYIDGDLQKGDTLETVSLFMASIENEFEQIKQIEVQAVDNEYLWIPDPILTRKAVDFEE